MRRLEISKQEREVGGLRRAARIKSIGDKYKKNTTFGVRFSNDGKFAVFVLFAANKRID